MRALVLIAALTAGSSGCANRHVNRTTLLASTATLACDWAQTRDGAAGGWNGIHEGNPVMGRTPSVGVVDAYFATVAIANAAIWYLLPDRLKSVIPGAVTAVQVRTVKNNISNGGFCL